MLLTSTHNICFYGEIRKNYFRIIIKYSFLLLLYDVSSIFITETIKDSARRQSSGKEKEGKADEIGLPGKAAKTDICLDQLQEWCHSYSTGFFSTGELTLIMLGKNFSR